MDERGVTALVNRLEPNDRLIVSELSRLGYARVSTDEQNLDLQQDALGAAGCEKVFVDKMSGSMQNRRGLQRALDSFRRGDTLVVWRLDRLGRSLKNLIELVTNLDDEGVAFQSIQEAIDTTSPGGKLVFHIFGALAEFERNLIRERTNAGLSSARVRGRKGGRPKSLDQAGRKLAVQLYNDGKHSVMDVCRMVGVSKPTLYKYVKDAN